MCSPSDWATTTTWRSCTSGPMRSRTPASWTASTRPSSAAAPSSRPTPSSSAAGSMRSARAPSRPGSGATGRPGAAPHDLGFPNTMPVPMAGRLEIWAARLWNVFNEGRPFSLVYPALVLLVAAPLGLVGALPLAAVLARFPFALRGRLLLWLAAALAAPLLEPWRAPTLLAAALAGYVAFTVFVWGTLYYRLRTGAPWTNFLRFWRLVLTNSDPTSGNALEQVPKLLMTLSAANLLAEEPSAWPQVAASAALTAALGAL